MMSTVVWPTHATEQIGHLQTSEYCFLDSFQSTFLSENLTNSVFKKGIGCSDASYTDGV